MDELPRKNSMKWLVWLVIVILVIGSGIFAYLKLTQKTGCENGICKTDIDSSYNCNINNFSMAFILIVNDRSELTAERINKLNSIKTLFSNEFYTATDGLASMDTSYPVFTILKRDLTDYSYESISKKFYETNPDEFDFISIFANNGSGTGLQTSHTSAQNMIKGIGIGIYNITSEFGSNGRLLGVNYERDLDIQSGTGTLLHETSHQWCCYVGDNFYLSGTNIPLNSSLGIIQESMHFFSGLDSSYQCSTPLGAQYWIANGDGTFRQSKDCLEFKKFHPFQLYFMGLYNSSNFNFNRKFDIYYAELDMNSKALPYKKVSIQDIIDVEGKRECQNNLSSMAPTLPTIT